MLCSAPHAPVPVTTTHIRQKAVTAALSNQEIFESIFEAIRQRRLLPGTKLSEARLAQAFHTNRSRIREVLMRLGQERVVELHANRGAFVSKVNARDLREVFDMRRALERAVIAQLTAQYGGHAVVALRSHVHSEERARTEQDRPTLARLTAEFHVRLAEMTENSMFSESLRRLSALTSLAIAQYDSHASSACPPSEHGDLVSAIEKGDIRRAERLMVEHLDHVEHGIQQPTEEPVELDFENIFRLSDGQSITPPRKRQKKAGKAS